MNKCGYCGMKVRTDNPVEFWCGSYGNGHRSKECMGNEIGLLKEHVRRLEKAGDLMHWYCADPDAVDVWNQAKESTP